ncbi:hypothetical protein BDAP_002809 [Binucleata daphniae]
MKMKLKRQVKIVFNIFVHFFPLLISLVYNNYDNDIYKKIDKLNKKIDDAYKDTYENLKNMFYEHVILVYSPNDKLVSHLNLSCKDENNAIYCNKSIQSHTKQLNLHQLADFFGSYSRKTVFLFTNHKQMLHYNELRKQNKKVSFDDQILKNISNVAKKNAIMQNYNEVYNLSKKYATNKMVLHLLHSSYETQGCFVTFSYRPYIEDDLYMINSYINEKTTDKYASTNYAPYKYAINYYQNINAIWQKALIKLFEGREKIEWVNYIVTSVLDYFFRCNLLKKRINISNYPETIPLLFPIKFVDEKQKYFVYNEIIRFCVNLRNIKDFEFYSDFFNKIKVDEIIELVPELYFSEIITKDLLVNKNEI